MFLSKRIQSNERRLPRKRTKGERNKQRKKKLRCNSLRIGIISKRVLSRDEKISGKRKKF